MPRGRRAPGAAGSSPELLRPAGPRTSIAPRSGAREGAKRGWEGGFTYLGVLALLVLIGLFLAAAGEVASKATQREREAQLLWVGHQYRAAIGHFWTRRRAYPQTLEELLGATALGTATDTAVPVRDLRQLYPDPMTNAADWVLVPGPSGGIMGVASRSKQAPLKTGHFDPEDAFSSATSYGDWQFLFQPGIFRRTVPAP